VKGQALHIGIKNEASSSTLELHFLSAIYDTYNWWTGEQVNMVEDTINQIKTANPSKIKCIINSGGGDLTIGLAIYNFLKSYDAKVETEIIGMAGSTASILALAAKKGKCKMCKNAFLMIHQGTTGAYGKSDEIRNTADVLDKYNDQLYTIYADKSGKTKEEFKTLLASGDVWLTANEALEMGLVDEIINDVPNITASTNGLEIPVNASPK
jgi:ATP-dependent Clp endopeptidase proteolytic subunit ClpP